MIRRAVSFIVRHGPASDQDRWEEDAGINTFTLAACIAALVCGAKYLAAPAASIALRIADYWNSCLEDWTAIRDTPLARRHGIDGYYVRVASSQAIADRGAFDRTLPIRNSAMDPGLPAWAQIGVDFLQLVRFGLRRPDDPLVVGSVKLADALLKVDTPNGPCWHRYNDDGYGEHDDGSAYDGTGRGRAWPLLTGERGHYELALGNDPLPLIEAMARMVSPGGMLPEQIWDAEAIPRRSLYPGNPTGAAMPLAWAHAEYIKLVASRALGYPFDRPDAVWKRYAATRVPLTHAVWTSHAPVSEIPQGVALTLAADRPGAFRWSIGDGQHDEHDTHEQSTTDSGLGLHYCTLDGSRLRSGEEIRFMFRADDAEGWDGRAQGIRVVAAT